jgi:hypothetical protein
MVARLDDILDNPFRLLGLDTSASARQFSRAAEDLCAAIRIGQQVSTPDLFHWLEPLRLTEDSVIAARRNLQDEKHRDSIRFFWLWFGYPSEEVVRSALLAGDTASAIRTLRAEVDMYDAVAASRATHDLGLLQLAVASIDAEIDRACDGYRRALGLLLATARQVLSDEQKARKVSERLLSLLAERVRSLVDEGNLRSACALYNILLDCPYDEDLRTRAAAIPFSNYFATKIALCNEFKNESNSFDAETAGSQARRRIYEIADQFEEQVIGPIDEITDLCEFYADDIEPACDAALDCARSMSICLHNELDDSKRAYELLVLVDKLPASESKLHTIEEGTRMLAGKVTVQAAVEAEKSGDFERAAKQYREAISRCNPEERSTLAERAAHCERMMELGGRVTPAGADLCLNTWNGLGCKFYGCTHVGRDGSYVTTHWFVVLFIPFIALGRYFVKPSPRGGWHIMGRLPVMPWQKYYSLCIVLAVVLCFVIAGMTSNSGGSSDNSYDTSSTTPSSAESSSTYSANSDGGVPSDTTGTEDLGDTSSTYSDQSGNAERERLHTSIKNADSQLESWQSQLESWRAEIDRIDGEIVSLKAEKESIERSADLGESVDESRYHAIVAEANRLVRSSKSLTRKHNALVREYNSLVNERNDQLKHLKALVGDNQ